MIFDFYLLIGCWRVFLNNMRNVVKDKSYDLALRIVKLCKYLRNDKREFVLSKQVLRSGTSIGANIEEAIGGHTKKEFISKLSIAYKESRETHYWLRLLKDAEFISKTEFDSIVADLIEVQKLLVSILKTSKKNNEDKESVC